MDAMGMCATQKNVGIPPTFQRYIDYQGSDYHVLRYQGQRDFQNESDFIYLS